LTDNSSVAFKFFDEYANYLNTKIIEREKSIPSMIKEHGPCIDEDNLQLLSRRLFANSQLLTNNKKFDKYLASSFSKRSSMDRILENTIMTLPENEDKPYNGVYFFSKRLNE